MGLMNKCGEIQEPLLIESSDNELNLTLSVKSEFYAKRGVFAHFTAVGCPTPKYPKQGYLVHGIVIEILTPSVGEKSLREGKSAHPVWYPGPDTVSGWGYVQNMGYPQYYRGPHQCTWTIRATRGRRVLLTLL